MSKPQDTILFNPMLVLHVYTVRKIPMVTPGRLGKPLEGSKKTSREDDARSSNIEVKDGGSNGLPFAIYIALMAYL